MLPWFKKKACYHVGLLKEPQELNAKNNLFIHKLLSHLFPRDDKVTNGKPQKRSHSSGRATKAGGKGQATKEKENNFQGLVSSRGCALWNIEWTPVKTLLVHS